MVTEQSAQTAAVDCEKLRHAVVGMVDWSLPGPGVFVEAAKLVAFCLEARDPERVGRRVSVLRDIVDNISKFVLPSSGKTTAEKAGAEALIALAAPVIDFIESGQVPPGPDATLSGGEDWVRVRDRLNADVQRALQPSDASGSTTPRPPSSSAGTPC